MIPTLKIAEDRGMVVPAGQNVTTSYGMGQKPDDWFAVFACSACHDSLDRRDAATAGEWGHEDALRALYLTLKQQFRDGIYVPGS